MPHPLFSTITFSIANDAGWDNARRWLVGHRKRMLLTQKVVAERMGWSQSQVSDFERGKTDPLLSTVARYLRAVELGGKWEAKPIEEERHD
jgi:predicted transcriptional regulator